MGKLVEGEWITQDVITSDGEGGYDREPRSFNDIISKDHEKFRPEENRYHLYVSYACPWAHRTLIYRKLKGLEKIISVSVVHPDMLDQGWVFDQDLEGATGDTLYGSKKLQEIYLKADPKVSTTVTVPILWDKKNETIVNNESSEIIRILNHAFDDLTGNKDDYFPEEWKKEIEEWNNIIYPNINNGVYKTGFARKQEIYEKECHSLFKTLDKIENHLEGKSYLVAERLTEADLRLIPTLLRFDAVYYGHFKCNKKRISDYKNLSRYLKSLYKNPGVGETTNLSHIKRHYYYSHDSVNPTRIVPLGPDEVF